MPNRSVPPSPPAAYWWCQAGGWSGYFLVNVFTSVGFVTPSWRLVSGYLFLSVLGVFLSHGYRAFILRRGWIDLPVPKLIPRALAIDFLLAVILVALVTLYFFILPPTGHSYGEHGRVAVIATWGVFIFNGFIIFTSAAAS